MDTIVRHNLRPAVVARWFRVHPVTCVIICAMRLELIGCQNGLHGKRNTAVIIYLLTIFIRCDELVAPLQ
jgi:hypothetical protein